MYKQSHAAAIITVGRRKLGPGQYLLQYTNSGASAATGVRSLLLNADGDPIADVPVGHLEARIGQAQIPVAVPRPVRTTLEYTDRRHGARQVTLPIRDGIT